MPRPIISHRQPMTTSPHHFSNIHQIPSHPHPPPITPRHPAFLKIWISRPQIPRALGLVCSCCPPCLPPLHPTSNSPDAGIQEISQLHGCPAIGFESFLTSLISTSPASVENETCLMKSPDATVDLTGRWRPLGPSSSQRWESSD